MAATHITEAKKAQALRDQADAMRELVERMTAIEAQNKRILELLEKPAKQAAASKPEKVEPEK